MAKLQQEGSSIGSDSPEGILEVNVTNSPQRESGQPIVAVNPKDPSNLVFVSTNHVGNHGPTPDKLYCLAAYSIDGGQTWSRTRWPYGDRPYAGHPYLAVDSHGIFYISFNRLGRPDDPSGEPTGTYNGIPNHLAVSRSRDGGRTWSDPLDTPLARAVSPRVKVDLANDRIYALGAGERADAHAVSVSADQGVTWTPIAPLPQQPFGNQIAVHDGILATATALKLVGREVTTTDVRFWVSFDEGLTFVSYPVRNGEGALVPAPSGPLVPNPKTLASTDPIPWVAADPTRRGGFALMLPRGDNLEVYISADAGRAWTGPAVIAAPGAAKPAIEFGPTGALGVMWRTLVNDAIDAYSSVSFDGGKSFCPPLKLNQATHPYGNASPGGDKWSRILLDRKYAYITWADSRSPETLDGIMSRVPLSLYQSHRGGQ